MDRFSEFQKKASEAPPVDDVPIDGDGKHVTIAVAASPEPKVSPEDEKMEIPIFLEQDKEIRDNLVKIKTYAEQIEKQHTISITTTKQDEVEACSAKVKLLTGNLNQLSNQCRMTLKNMDERTKELAPLAAKGSGSIRMRQVKQRQLVESFTEVMKKYKKSQEKFDDKYKAQLERQIKIVNPDVSKDEIKKMMEDPEGARQLMFDLGKRKAAEKDLKDMKDRFEDVKQIAESIMELQQMFMEMDEMITQQGDVINRIDHNVENIEGFTEEAKEDLKDAVESQKSIMKKKWIMAVLIIILILIGLGIIAYFVRPLLKLGGGKSNSVKKSKQRNFIAESCGILQEKKLKHEIHAMGTNVEGSLKTILEAVSDMRIRCHEMGSDKVDIHIVISSRKEPATLQAREKRVLESHSAIPED